MGGRTVRKDYRAVMNQRTDQMIGEDMVRNRHRHYLRVDTMALLEGTGDAADDLAVDGWKYAVAVALWRLVNFAALMPEAFHVFSRGQVRPAHAPGQSCSAVKPAGTDALRANIVSFRSRLRAAGLPLHAPSVHSCHPG